MHELQFLDTLVPNLKFLATVSLTALLVSLLIVVAASHVAPFFLDHPGAVQKAHDQPTPRVGGLAIYLGLLAGWVALPAGAAAQLLGLILLAGVPACLFGLLEDVTKRVGVLPRLLATMFSGVLASLLSGVALSRVDVPLLDTALAYWPLAVLFTAFAVGGVANAINIIDGFHGVASGTSIMALLAMAVLSMLAGDTPLAVVCLMATAAVAGFWLVNYPWGKLFLGDGGAYFTGFVLAWVAVLLPMRNPDTSPWASLMVCAYPFIEVVYTMLRRRIERRSLGAPDSEHLHSLLASQVVRRHFTGLSSRLQNAAVAPIVWVLVAFMIWLAIEFRQHSGWLMGGMLLSATLYHLCYGFLARRRRRQPVDHPAANPPQGLNPTN
jgi:UDP-N-acetylmuramyl pentapeptide phosphotransferase/UDP-N-acetylglucosamine-1-phosphate transferase